jgi:hypothetical protein
MAHHVVTPMRDGKRRSPVPRLQTTPPAASISKRAHKTGPCRQRHPSTQQSLTGDKP